MFKLVWVLETRSPCILRLEEAGAPHTAAVAALVADPDREVSTASAAALAHLVEPAERCPAAALPPSIESIVAHLDDASAEVQAPQPTPFRDY